MNHEILLGLTTTSFYSWKDKLSEAESLGISRIAMFPTTLDPAGRQELYVSLEKSPVISVPHVHLREDMLLDELQYLSDRFGTQVFNIHSDGSSHPSLFSYDRFIPQIFVENSDVPPSQEELARYGGICIDFSHLETARLSQFEKYEDFWKIMESAKIGCCHVSPFAEHQPDAESFFENTSHWSHDLSEFNYVQKYLPYLPEFISLEVANPFKEQLEIKAHLERIIGIKPSAL